MECQKRNHNTALPHGSGKWGILFMTTYRLNMTGLTSVEAKRLQAQYGKNELAQQKKESLLKKVFHIICEPMFLLLIVAAIIYFLLGEPRDGAIMLIFVVGIISIDVIQEWKTDKTLNALKDLSAPIAPLSVTARNNRLPALIWCQVIL